MMSRFLLAVSLFAASTFVASEASAQVYVQTQPQTVYVQPQPQPVYAQPQPVYVQQQPQPVYVQPQPQPMPPPMVMGPPRIRYGFDGGLGYFGAFRGGLNAHGLGINGTARIGFQGSDLWAIYGQVGAFLGFGIGNVAGILLSVPITLAADFTFGNVFHVGGGPSLDVAIGGVGGSGGAIGAFPGLDLHIAVSVAGRNAYGGRTGLMLGLRPHFTVLFNNSGYEGTYVSVLGFAGYEWF